MPATDVEKTDKTTAPAVTPQIMLTLSVIGMTCAACQSHVERALRSTAGVRDASVNLLANSSRVSFNPAVAKLEDLIASVREAGYDATLPNDSLPLPMKPLPTRVSCAPRPSLLYGAAFSSCCS